MKVENLVSPGVIVGSAEARRVIAKLVSKVELQSNATQAAAVIAFLNSAANACAAAVGSAGTNQFVPSTSAVVANGASIPVYTSAGTVSAVATVASPGVATVAGGVLTKVTGHA